MGAWVVILAVLGATGEANLELGWEAPPDCPTRADVLADLARLGPGEAAAPDGSEQAVAPVAADREPLRAHGRVGRDEHGGWLLELRVGEGQRRLVAARCEELAQAAALVLALALAEAEPPRGGRAALTSTAASPAPATSPSPASSQVGLWISIGPHVDAGTLPHPAAGARLSLQAAKARRALSLELSFLAPSAAAGAREGTGATFFLLQGGLAAGSAWDWGRWGLRAETGLAAGWLAGQGFGLVENLAGGGVWSAATLGVEARWSATDTLGVGLSLQGGAALTRPAFGVEGQGVLFQPGRLFGRLALTAHGRIL